MIQNMIDSLPKPKLQRLKDMEKKIEEERQWQRELKNRESMALFAGMPDVMSGRYPEDAYDSNLGFAAPAKPISSNMTFAVNERERRIRKLKEELY